MPQFPQPDKIQSLLLNHNPLRQLKGNVFLSLNMINLQKVNNILKLTWLTFDLWCRSTSATAVFALLISLHSPTWLWWLNWTCHTIRNIAFETSNSHIIKTYIYLPWGLYTERLLPYSDSLWPPFIFFCLNDILCFIVFHFSTNYGPRMYASVKSICREKLWICFKM